MILAKAFILAAVMIGATIPWTPAEPPAKTAEPATPAGPQKPIKEYDEREAAFAAAQPCKEDSLVLPLAKVKASEQPRKVPAGQRPQFSVMAPPSGVAWAVTPWRAEHEEFLARWGKAASDDEKLRLADWCTASHLAPCAEFIWRDILCTYWDNFSTAAGQKALAAWAAAPHGSPYLFDLPVRGEWYVEKDAKGLFKHKPGTYFAHNLIIMRGGREFTGTGNDTANFFAWGQPIYSVADGVVTTVEDGNYDPRVGESVGPNNLNFVIVDCGGGVWAYYGHIKKGSATVKARENVQRGQVIAQVGNAGGNGRPHLHFILMDGDYFSIPGRYRFEESTGRAPVLRDGADLREETFIRPAPEPRGRPVPPAARATGEGLPRR